MDFGVNTMQQPISDPVHTIWNMAVDNLEKVIPQQNFVNWIEPIQFNDSYEDTIVLTVPNQFFKEWLLDNYFEMIKSAVSFAANKTFTIKFKLNTEESEIKQEHLYIKEDNITDEVPENTNKQQIKQNNVALNPRYTFNHFVSGSGNQFAHAAASAVANNPANTYNPLFIYGGVGLGKSHLLNAIGHHVLEKNPDINICYCSAEKFMHEMVNCIKLNKMDEFRSYYRSVDLLLIDDIQFISGKERTQIEFFHTFNNLYENNKQIAITSDKFPKEIPNLEERLRSRFEWGLIADIQPPDLETKIAILNKKSETNNIKLPNDVAYFLASSEIRNVRELEGMLIRLGAYSSLQNIPITLEMAKHNLKDILVDKKKEINIDLIQKVTAEYFGLKVADLKSDKRLKAIVQARQIALWLCRDMTTASFPDIGSKFGGKDHSTVIYSVNKIEKQKQTDNKTQEIIEEIKNILLK